MYGSVSEVIEDALRKFFKPRRDILALRQEITETRERLNQGEEKPIDGKVFSTQIDAAE